MELPAPPWIAAHRGAMASALENSLRSFALAVEQGADLVELDVRLTTDGTLVVLHDETLERVAASTLSAEEVDWSTLSEIRLHDGNPLPRLEDVFAALPPGYPVNVELKRTHAARERVALAASRLAGRPNVVVSSFDWQLLERLRARSPALVLAPLAGDGAPLEDLLALADRVGAWSIHVSRQLARRAMLPLAAHGRPVLCFTVNEPDEARYLFDSGASGVFADHPAALRRALGLSGPPSVRMLGSSP